MAGSSSTAATARRGAYLFYASSTRRVADNSVFFLMLELHVSASPLAQFLEWALNKLGLPMQKAYQPTRGRSKRARRVRRASGPSSLTFDSQVVCRLHRVVRLLARSRVGDSPLRELPPLRSAD